MRRLLIIFLSTVCFALNSQIDISTLSNLGIKSEQDLKDKGLSSAEISTLKQEYFNGNLSGQKPANNDLAIQAKLPVKTAPKPLNKPDNFDHSKEGNQAVSASQIYGKNIFTDGSVTIKNNSDRIKAPDDYILGTGDVISIVIWGTSEFSSTFSLDEYGNITPSLVGRISLKGKKFIDAKKIINSSFGRVYDLKNSHISIEISYSKVININIAGEVKNPGTYTIPSINSAFNFLSLAGGISNLGSLRNIKIIHTNGDIELLDVYSYLLNPVDFKHKYLKDGDFIIVPTVKNIVEVKGVRRSMKYELKPNESLTDLLLFSGGISNTNDQRVVHIERLKDSGVELLDIWQKDFNSFILKDGDKLEFYPVDQSLINSVTIKGSIVSAGKYAYKKEENISQLIARSGGVIPNSIIKVCHIYRLNKLGYREIIRFDMEKVLTSVNVSIKIEPHDIIYLFDQRSLNHERHIRITGNVKNPNKYNFIDNLQLEDLILLAGGTKLHAEKSKIDIDRMVFDNSENSYIRQIEVDLNNVKGFPLMPFDIVHIRRLPEFSFQQLITIKGEVKYPGNYSISSQTEKLSDLLKRAGGVTNQAFMEGGFIIRTKDSIGLVIVKLKDVLKSDDSKYNYILKPGDIISIPKISNTVSITGGIGFTFQNEDGERKISCPYTPGKRASYYIHNYGGGFNKNANKRDVYVIHQNGLVEDSRFFGFLRPKIQKGDLVRVKIKPTKAKKEKEERVDWNRTIESLSVKITGLATLWILVQRINL